MSRHIAGLRDKLELKSQIVRDGYSRNFIYPTLFVFLLSLPLLHPDVFPAGRLLIFIIACLVGFKSVYTTFFILTASIIIPDQGLAPFTATQLSLVIWMFSWLIWQRDFHVHISRKHIFYCAPCLFWIAISGLTNSDYFMLNQFFKGLVVSLIAYHILSLENVKPELCFLHVLLGVSLAAIPWYLITFLHVSGFETKILREFGRLEYLSLTGLVRYSITKQDPNAISMLLNFLFWGAINILIRIRSLKILFSRVLLILLAGISIPPLIATNSRTALITFALAGTLTILLWVKESILGRKYRLIGKNEDSSGRRKNKYERMQIILPVVMFAFAIIAIVASQATFNLIEFQWMDRITSVADTIMQKGLDDRGLIFSSAWNEIKGSPFYGIGLNTFLMHYNLASHNTFLDFGLAAGIPGMIAFIIIAALPIFSFLFRLQRSLPSTSIYIVCYCVIIIGMMSLSIEGDKLFWMLWSMIVFTIEKSSRLDRQNVSR